MLGIPTRQTLRDYFFSLLQKPRGGETRGVVDWLVQR